MTSMTNAPSSRAVWQNEAVLSQHRAFCDLALPMRTPKGGSWSRAAGGISAKMGPDGAASDELQPLPAGRTLRFLLLYLFTTALRGGTAAVEIGPDPAAVAGRLGLEMTPSKLKELSEQIERLLSARLRVSVEGKAAPISVLDARRFGGRGGTTAWRPVLHLTERFFASLQQSAVPLDRTAVECLPAPALDAYAWLAATLPEANTGRPLLASWTELQQRFGSGEASGSVAFRTAFTKRLEAARQVWPTARFTVDQSGVELQGIAISLATAGLPMLPSNLVPERGDAPVQVAALTAPALCPKPRAAPDQGQLRAETHLPAEPSSAPKPPPLAPASEPQPVPIQPAGPKLAPERVHKGGRIRLAPELTGLGLSVWLRPSGNEESVTIEVTHGAEYNPARRSLLILEPMILQVVGSLQQRELEQVAAWAVANAELIQEYWDSSIGSDIAGRVKPVPIQRW
jgi:hypothetical protein